jgi:hypothetical protein
MSSSDEQKHLFSLTQGACRSGNAARNGLISRIERGNRRENTSSLSIKELAVMEIERETSKEPFEGLPFPLSWLMY